MSLQVFSKERRHAAYGFLNQGTNPNEYDLFVLVLLEEGKTAVFKEEQHFLSGETSIEIDIVNAENGQTAGNAAKHYLLQPAKNNSVFDPEFCYIEIKVNQEGAPIVADFHYKDCDNAVLAEMEVEEEIVYNTAYVHLAQLEESLGQPAILAPRIIVPVKGQLPSLMEEVTEGDNILKTVIILNKDEATGKEVLIPEAINQLEYPEIAEANGHFTVMVLQAKNAQEALELLMNAVQGKLTEAQENKTRKARVRKRRTATRYQGDSNQDQGKQDKDKKDVKKVPPRKGKVRKKYTHTRELGPTPSPEQ